jgi:beta-lactamase class D
LNFGIKALSAAAILAISGGFAIGQDITDVADIFAAENIEGTLVVATADGMPVHVFNEARSRVQFCPASTFKIPNTLIALAAGVATSKETRYTWDGENKGRPAWNQDQTLESAFRVSCVWCYQEIARDVGSDRYITDLAGLDYGNQDIGEEVDMFWLNGDLKISAAEQIEFLSAMLNYEVSYQREHVDLVKDIMLVEKTDEYSLRAKAGWTGPALHTGWYVGYVEKGDEVWLFAMNMELENVELAGLRKDLTVRSLEALGIL